MGCLSGGAAGALQVIWRVMACLGLSADALRGMNGAAATMAVNSSDTGAATNQPTTKAEIQATGAAEARSSRFGRGEAVSLEALRGCARGSLGTGDHPL